MMRQTTKKKKNAIMTGEPQKKPSKPYKYV